MELYGTDLKNIKMPRGDSESITVNGLSLVAEDTIYFTVKTNTNTKVISFQKKITEFVNGSAVIPIEHSDTKDLNFGRYVYDIQLTKADGTVTTVIQPHEFKIGEEVTYD